MLENSDRAESTFVFRLLESRGGGSTGEGVGGGGLTYLGLSPLPTQDGPLQENYLLGGQTPVAGGKRRKEEKNKVLLDEPMSTEQHV